MTGGIFLAFGLFFLKHFIVDFPLQRWPYQFKNKGTWGHPGGVLHSGLHAVATFICLMVLAILGIWGAGPEKFSEINLAWVIALLLSLLEGFTHYVIDYAKMNINRIMDWHANTTEWFWHLLGLDQLLHYLTYLFVLYVWFMA